jgi:hypothetical protein
MSRTLPISPSDVDEDDDENAPGLTFEVRVVHVRRGVMRVVTMMRGRRVVAIVKVPTKR